MLRYEMKHLHFLNFLTNYGFVWETRSNSEEELLNHISKLLEMRLKNSDLHSISTSFSKHTLSAEDKI